MEYKIGDKVQIRTDISRYSSITFGFGVEMEKYRGKTVTIVKEYMDFKKRKGFRIKEDEGRWAWHESMFIKNKNDAKYGL